MGTSSYPYTARDGSCKSGSASGVTIGGYKTVTKSDSGLASALGSSAVTVMVYADSTFQHYSSGILSGVSTTLCWRQDTAAISGRSRTVGALAGVRVATFD